jgi:tetratricopeptide (TPR) repeat protein
MGRRDRKSKKTDRAPPAGRSQRISRLKAKVLTEAAEQAWSSEQRLRTVALLTEALRRDPNNHDVLINLATAHGRRREYEQAEKHLNRLVELAPRKASVLCKVAGTYALIDRPEQAVECYRRALALNSSSSATVTILLELAGLYERRHELEDARAALDDALAREPNNEQARLQQAILARRQEQPAQAESLLRSLVSDPTRSAELRCQAWYELGQLLDDAERYGDAFTAFAAAKKILEPQAPDYLKKSRETLVKTEELVVSLDKAAYDRWRELARHDSPYRIAVLTGHPRSGTTLIEQVLDSHDQVISADEFDVWREWVLMPIVRRFPFSTPLAAVLDVVPPAAHKQARAAYWQQTESIFNEPIGGRMLLDKNPGMMVMLPVVNWTFPEMKMLIAIRDPRDIVLSCFMQKVSLSPISSNWLSLSGAAEYYARTMKIWLATRDLTPSPWHEFRYEDVVADLEGRSRRILDFLGLPWDDKVLKFYERAREKVVRSPTYRDVTQPVHQKSVGRWQHYAAHVEPILKTLEPFVKEFGYT